MDAKADSYTTFDIKEKLGIGIERQKDWRERGFIKPTLEKAKGQGTKNLFSRFDLYLIKMFELLIQWGYPRDQASWIVEDARNYKAIADEKPPNVEWNPEYAKAKRGVGEFKYLVVPWNFKGQNVMSIGNRKVKLSILFFGTVEELRLHMPTFQDADEIRIINFQKVKDQVDSALL